MKFLMGFNKVYTSIRGQILLMEPFPMMNKTYSLILQDEKQRGISTADGLQIEASAFAVRNNMKNFRKNHMLRSFPLRCRKCDKIGHAIEVCRAHLKVNIVAYKATRWTSVGNCRKRIPLVASRTNENQEAPHRRLTMQKQRHP